jgi:hypothetical protein
MIVMTIQEDGGKVETFTAVAANGGTVSWSGGFGLSGKGGSDFNIALAWANSNSPGSTLQGVANQANVFVVNNTGSEHTLHINVSAQGFTSPTSPPPLNVLDTVSGSGISGSVSGDFQGFADATNALFGTGFASSDLIFNWNGQSQSTAVNGSQYGFSPDANQYSLSIFGNFTFGANASVTLTGGNVQTVPTPTPAGLALVLAGLPILGLRYLRRRRPAVAT